MYSGFPLGPFHLLIALEMFVIVLIFARLHKAKKNVLKWVVFIGANGLLAPLPFYFLISPAFFIAAVPANFYRDSYKRNDCGTHIPSVENILKVKD